MTLAHVTKSGNVSIPKKWRNELGIRPESKVIMKKKNNTIVLEPMQANENVFKAIDDEIAKKKVTFTRKEAVSDDFYE